MVTALMSVAVAPLWTVLTTLSLCTRLLKIVFSVAMKDVSARSLLIWVP